MDVHFIDFIKIEESVAIAPGEVNPSMLTYSHTAQQYIKWSLELSGVFKSLSSLFFWVTES